MRFNHNDFKNKLKNNPKIQNDFKTIKARYENEILNAPKKETFFNKLVNFFKSSAFKASLLTSSFVVIILIIVGSLLLPNLINKNEDDPIITTPPIFTGISLKEESTKITSTSKVNNVETLNLNDETFKTVDELIDTSLSLPKDNNYYVDFNEDIILDVAFYNPFKFEIISFEIISSNDNQVFKFTNYMFLNGSNLEHIYVNPEKMGNQIVTYKIDNIKYIDGTEIKICPKEGNDTLTVYPRYYFNPIVNKLRSNIYLNEVKFDYQINDISSSLFNPKLYVSNGYELIYEEEITNYNFVHLELNNLYPNSKYHLAIFGFLNKKDGNDKVFSKIYEEFFTTPNYFKSVSLSPSYEDLTLDITSLDENAKLKEINLYFNDGTFYKNYLINKRKTNLTLNNLYSNKEYILELIVSNLNGLYLSESYYSFKTLTYETPNINIINFGTQNNYYTFDLDIYDPSLRGYIKSTTLYGDTKLIFKEDKLVNYFEGLEYNVNYTLIVIYEYNLNDNTGNHEIIINKEFETTLSDISIEDVDYEYYAIKDQIFNVKITINNPSNINIYQIKVDEIYYPAIKVSALDYNEYYFQITSLNEIGIKTFTITGYNYYLDNNLIEDTFIRPRSINVNIQDEIILKDVYSTKKEDYFEYFNEEERIYISLNLPEGFNIYELYIENKQVITYEQSNDLLIVKPYDNYLKACEDQILYFLDRSNYYFKYVYTITLCYGTNINNINYINLKIAPDKTPLKAIAKVLDIYTINDFKFLDELQSYNILMNLHNDLEFNNLDNLTYLNLIYNCSNVVSGQENGYLIGNNHTITVNNLKLNTELGSFGFLVFERMKDLTLNINNFNSLIDEAYIYLLGTTNVENVTINIDNFKIKSSSKTHYSTLSLYSYDHITYYAGASVNNLEINGLIEINNSYEINLLSAGCIKNITNLNFNLSVIDTSSILNETSYACFVNSFSSNLFGLEIKNPYFENVYINGSYLLDNLNKFDFIDKNSFIPYTYHNLVINENNYFSSNFNNNLNPDWEI